MNKQRPLKELLSIIESMENPYPPDIFCWVNAEPLSFNRGRFNEFIWHVVENTRKDIIKAIKEEFE